MKRIFSPKIIFFILVLFPIGGIYIYNYWNEKTYSGIMYSAYKLKREHIIQDVFFNQVEPEIPNEKDNDLNILGVDSNHNGIRDDIDIWINRASGEKKTHLALTEYALVIQKIINDCKATDKQTKDKLVQLSQNLQKLNWRFANNPNYFVEKILILTLNTDHRKKCYY